MNQLVPVTLLTGFLGSGKTTLLSNLIKHTSDQRLAVLINEYGEVSIDGAILRGNSSIDSVEIHDIANSLVAYSREDQFSQTMKVLSERKHTIDHVLIESSGLALPTAVMQALRESELSNHFVLDATLVIVDTPLMLEGQFDPGTAHGAIFVQQLDVGDIVVLNKIDQLDEDTLLTAENRIRTRAPNIRFVELAFDAMLDPRTTLGLRLNQATYKAGHHAFASGASHADGHSHSGLDAHRHGIATHEHVHEHDPGWLTFMLHSHHVQKEQDLRRAVKQVALSEPLLRAKGFAQCEEFNQPVLIQAVRDRVTLITSPRTTEDIGDSNDPDHPRRTEEYATLVFIGYHLERQNVTAIMNEFTGTRWE